MIDSINTNTYSAPEKDSDSYEEHFTPLNASLLGPNRKRNVVSLEKKRVERAEEIRKQQKKTQKKSKDDDLDLNELLGEDNPFGEDDKNNENDRQTSNSEDELDEMAIIKAELARLDGERRG